MGWGKPSSIGWICVGTHKFGTLWHLFQAKLNIYYNLSNVCLYFYKLIKFLLSLFWYLIESYIIPSLPGQRSCNSRNQLQPPGWKKEIFFSKTLDLTISLAENLYRKLSLLIFLLWEHPFLTKSWLNRWQILYLGILLPLISLVSYMVRSCLFPPSVAIMYNCQGKMASA